MLTPIVRSMLGNSHRACLQSSKAAYSCIANQNKFASLMSYQWQQPKQYQTRQIGSDTSTYSNAANHEKPVSLAHALENEIQEEMAELNQRLSSDQFPGFSVETDGADVKLTKQSGDATVVVRFTVSSSLSEWRTEADPQDKQPAANDDQEVGFAYQLLSLPEFQVQINRDGKTFEISCFFEELDHDEETGEPYAMEPVFHIDEIVMYEGEPRETEFAVSTEYFRDGLQDSLVQYLADHGIDEEFSKNLVSFATNYEKKQYIGLMKRLKEFVSK